jgi:hypothetical protein
MDISKKNNNIVCGVYTLQGVEGKNAVKIKHIDTVYVNETERIQDTCIDGYEISKHIAGTVFACNITNTYLTQSRKQPMIYIDVWWTKYMRKVLLYRLFLYFNIEDDAKSYDEFLKKQLKGTFSIEVTIEDKSMPLEKTIEKFEGNKKMKDLLIKFTKNDKMNELHKDLIATEEHKLTEKFAKEFEGYKTIPKATILLTDTNKNANINTKIE